MPRCKECAWYQSGGFCKNPSARNKGFTCPIATAGECYKPTGVVVPDAPAVPYKEKRIPKSQRRGRGAAKRPFTHEEYQITKTCICCGKTKALYEFYRTRRYKDGHLNTCISCIKAKYRARVEAKKESKESQ